MKSQEDQKLEAQAAFKQWSTKGTVPLSYLRNRLGDPMVSVSPNVPLTVAVGRKRDNERNDNSAK